MRQSMFSGLVRVVMLAASMAMLAMQSVIECGCPCLPADGGQRTMLCDVRTNGVNTDRVIVAGTACFQGPVQLCSGGLGLLDPALDGLWLIGQFDQVAGPGVSTLQTVARTRSINCTGAVLTIDFNQQTLDPADAFTLLKTIQAGDTLQFTRINPSSCAATEVISACAAGGVTGCGPVFAVSIFNASGLMALYGAAGEYVSLLNFGQKPSVQTQIGQQQDCSNCFALGSSDALCWPVQICSGLMTNVIPPECASMSGAAEHLLVNADHLGAVTIVAVPKITQGGFSATDSLCAMRAGDRLRVYASGISSYTPLNAPPAQEGWSTSVVEPFGPAEDDQANAVTIDRNGNVILAGAHALSGSGDQFAALQLLSNGTSVALGWATALSGVFGPSLEDVANGVVLDVDGNPVLAGFTFDAANVRFAAAQLIPSGIDVQLGWSTALAEPFGLGNDWAQAIIRANDNSLILAGIHSTLASVEQFAALQLIPNGTSVQLGWATALLEPFGPVGSNGDIVRAVALDNDGNIILAGHHTPFGLGSDTRFAALQLIPVGSSVQLGWATALSGAFGPNNDRALGVAVDCNDTVILAGFHFSGGFGAQMAALQLVPDGASVGLGWVDTPLLPNNSANSVVIDHNNTIILGGDMNVGLGVGQFAAVQLVPNDSAGVDTGWSDFFSFMSGSSSSANAIAIDQNNNVILGGSDSSMGRDQFAALQLRQPFVPAYGDYQIMNIQEVSDYIIFELSLIDTESSTICPDQALCIKDLGFCCS